MKNGNDDSSKQVAQIHTLHIYSDTELSKKEYQFLFALENLLNHFKTVENENIFCMYIQEKTFLIASNQKDKKVNPFAFVNEKGEILFDVNIKVFTQAIEEFQKYIQHYDKKQDYTEEKKFQLAVRDYKNDKLDFYSNSRLIRDELLVKACEQYEEEYGLE